MPSNLIGLYDGLKLSTASHDGNNRGMVISAHPDDGDLGAGGTVALLAQSGLSIRHIVVTDGRKGSPDPDTDQKLLVQNRLAEQKTAAKHLGVESVRSLSFPDGELKTDRTLLEALVREIREFKPEIVFTHDPESVTSGSGWIHHNDHRATGSAVIDAVYPAARDPLNFPDQIRDGLEVHNVQTLYLWDTNNANINVDISEVFEQKLLALLSHRSQFPNSARLVNDSRIQWQDVDGRYREEFRKLDLWA